MFEVIASRQEDLKNNDILSRMNLKENEYFVVSAHRDENINNQRNFLNLCESLNEIAKTYHLPVIVSTHPRTQNMIDALNIQFEPEVQLLKPLGFNDYVSLQMHAKVTLSDSGTISEESSILGFKALNLREAHERPEAMEEASVMMVGLHHERIMQALNILETQTPTTLRQVADYNMPNVSEKVLRIILSYTDYVNRNVWKKL